MRAYTSRVRVRYAETDKMGVAYYANYFVWFEVGRCELLRSLGYAYRDLETQGLMLPVVEAGCEYRDSARYDDDLAIATTGNLLSPVRVEFRYDVSRPDGTSIATGRTVHGAVGTSGRPRRLPEDIRAALS